MQHRSQQTSLLWLLWLLGFVSLSNWGCNQNLFTLYPSAEEARETSPRQNVTPFRFGAVHYTYTDVYAQPLTQSERLTQCAYGEVVQLVQETPRWYGVKVGPYPELEGWIHKSAITELTPQALYLRERALKTIVIREELSHVYIWPSQSIQIAMGTELPFLGEAETWYLVRLPTNDIGRIAKAAVYPSVEEQPLITSKEPYVPLPVDISQQRQEIITTAQRFLGKVYIWGGTTPRGFDCSGLSYLVYKLNGVELPRVSWNQFGTGIGKKIPKSDLTPGDLVFFQTYRKGASHVGIYVGNNLFIHASPQHGVTKSSLDDPYFKTRYVGAKTIFLTSDQKT